MCPSEKKLILLYNIPITNTKVVYYQKVLGCSQHYGVRTLVLYVLPSTAGYAYKRDIRYRSVWSALHAM